MQPAPASPAPTGVPYAQTNTSAITSLITGILAWLTLPISLLMPFVFCFSGVIGLVAVVTGHVGVRQVAQSAGRMTGRGLAVAGLALGYAMLFVSVVLPLCVALVLAVLALLGPAIGNVFSDVVTNI
jgi:hypothetical protein